MRTLLDWGQDFTQGLVFHCSIARSHERPVADELWLRDCAKKDPSSRQCHSPPPQVPLTNRLISVSHRLTVLAVSSVMDSPERDVFLQLNHSDKYVRELMLESKQHNNLTQLGSGFI